MQGIGSPGLFFLIASPTLIGSIYHSLQPRGSPWKFPRLWERDYLMLLTPHQLFKSSHPSTTHTHIHRSELTAVTGTEDHLLGMLKERGKGLSFNSQHINFSRGRWGSLLQTPTHCYQSITHSTPSFSVPIQCFLPHIQCIQDHKTTFAVKWTEYDRWVTIHPAALSYSKAWRTWNLQLWTLSQFPAAYYSRSIASNICSGSKIPFCLGSYVTDPILYEPVRTKSIN